MVSNIIKLVSLKWKDEARWLTVNILIDFIFYLHFKNVQPFHYRYQMDSSVVGAEWKDRSTILVARKDTH